MKKISIVMPIFWESERECVQYMPIVEELKINNRLCACYGIRNLKIHSSYCKEIKQINSPYLFSKVYSYYLRFMDKPLYKSLLLRLSIFDKLISKKVSRDSSEIVFTDMLLPKTISCCKKVGKKVVVYTGNSFPGREYNKITEEYKKFGITKKYIYGDIKYKERCLSSLALCDYYIAITHVSAKTYFDAGFKKEKCFVIPKTGTDFQVYREDLKLNQKEKAFITTAFHCFIKGTHRVLEAWKKTDLRNIKLYVIGDLNDDMKEYISLYGPFYNTVFMGACNRDDIKSLYERFDAVGILMSLSEGAGRVIPELMSYGFPMIVSPDATCDIVKNGYNGFIIEPEDEMGISNRIKWFAEDWKRVHLMRDNVYKTIKDMDISDFSKEVVNVLMHI